MSIEYLTAKFGPPPVIRLPMESIPPGFAHRSRDDWMGPNYFPYYAQESMLGQVDYTSAYALLTSREIDSGIDALETPLAFGEDSSSPSSSPQSTVSAPAAVATSSATGSVGSVSAGMSSPPSTPPPSPAALPSPWALFDRRQDEFAMAQLVHPADAVVFVGNLPANLPDYQLSAEIHEYFSQFGRVSVFVKRTTGVIQKPWALLQYQTCDAAQQAIDHGARTMFMGRNLRVMRSQARRHFIVRRDELPFVWGGPNELRDFFDQFGTIEQHIQKINGYGMVRFNCYGSYALAKDAVRSGTTPYAFW